MDRNAVLAAIAVLAVAFIFVSGIFSVVGVTKSLVASIDNEQTTPEKPWWVADISLSPGESQDFIIRAKAVQIQGYNITPQKEIRAYVRTEQPYCIQSISKQADLQLPGISATRYSLSGVPQHEFKLKFIFNDNSDVQEVKLDAAKLEGVSSVNFGGGTIKLDTEGAHIGPSDCPQPSPGINLYKFVYNGQTTYFFVQQTNPGFLQSDDMLKRAYDICMAKEFVLFGDEYYKRFHDANLAACILDKTSTIGAVQYDGVTLDYAKSGADKLYILATGMGDAQAKLYADAEVFDAVIVAPHSVNPVQLTCERKEVKADAYNQVAVGIKNPNSASVSASVSGFGKTQSVSINAGEEKFVSFSVNKPEGTYKEEIRACTTDFDSQKCASCALSISSDKENEPTNENDSNPDTPFDVPVELIYGVWVLAGVIALYGGYQIFKK